jgi:uncharacterized protein YcaQ
MGFVQADPIRAPARAQDLILRHRVRNYRAGDLDRRYVTLDVEEDVFINYGFVPREVWALMHPRESAFRWPKRRQTRAQAILAFVRDRGSVHPREVDEQFSHGTVTNYWGGSSNATTHLLDAMHYRGLLRVARRDRGIRIYAAYEHAQAPAGADAVSASIDALVDVAVNAYAPVPAVSLAMLVSRLRYAAPQWENERRAALRRARERLAHAKVDGVDWFWPRAERATGHEAPPAVRLLAPFDPVVWDRRRFELLWGWTYRFEAYTPEKKRKLGYYALPLLWRNRVIGWGNLTVENGELRSRIGYIASRPPREGPFHRELELELDRMRQFLRLSP